MVLLAFILTTIAGLSTLLGSLLILFIKPKSNLVIPCSLSFAGAVMLFISIFDLIPESYNSLNIIFNNSLCIIYILIFINIGIIISSLINKYIPDNNNNLYRVGVVTMLGIIMHNIPEGMATFIATNSDINLGLKMTIAISLHNIPEGISIAIPIYYSTKSKNKALLYTFISGFSELLGAIITYIFLKSFINIRVLGFLFASIAGIMIYISINDLLATALSYNHKTITFISFIIGIIFFLTTILIK